MSRNPLARSRATRSVGSSWSRRGPDVRLAAERREQDQRLGQAPVEGVGVGRPADRLEAVPERLRIARVVEEEAVAEVAQLAARDRVDLRLVEQEPAHRRRRRCRGCAVRSTFPYCPRPNDTERETGPATADVPTDIVGPNDGGRPCPASRCHRGPRSLSLLTLTLAACRRRSQRHRPARPARPPASASAADRRLQRDARTRASWPSPSRTSRSTRPTITAKVGDVIAFTNNDTRRSHRDPRRRLVHDADDRRAARRTGSSFSAAGTYPFHCKIHTDMKGTITVS